VAHWQRQGLRARGGFEVDIAWLDGKVTTCRVTQSKGITQ